MVSCATFSSIFDDFIMKFRVLIFPGLLCFWSGWGHALASAQAHGSAGYREALQLMWSYHPQLQAKRQEVRAAELGVTIAERQHWPTPSITAGTGPRFTGSPNTGDTRAMTASLSIPLYTGGLITAEQHIAALRWQAAELDLNQTAFDLSSQLVETYRQWWQAQSRVAMVKISMSRLQDLRAMMRRRAEAGVSSDTEVALTDAHIARFQDELAQNERLRDVANSDLNLMVGRPLTLHPENMAQWPQWQYTDAASLSWRIQEMHPALRYAEVQHAIALKDIERTKASAWPNLTLRAERQWGAYFGTLGPGDRISISSQTSLGAGLSNLKQQDQAAARADSAEQQIAVTRQRLESIAMRLYNDHEQAWVQWRNAQALVTQYDDITDSNLRLFASGRRSWIDLLNLLREQHQLRLQLADAQSNLLGARLRMAVLSNAIPNLSIGQP